MKGFIEFIVGIVVVSLIFFLIMSSVVGIGVMAEQINQVTACEEQYKVSCELVVVPNLAEASPLEALQILINSGE